MDTIDVRSFVQKLPSGNFYLPVSARIYIATKLYGERLCIRTTLVHHDAERGEYIVFAEVLLYSSNNSDKARLHATGLGRCTDKQFSKGALMKAESAAIGRALRAFGIGTEYALEDEEDDLPATGQLADSPVPPPPPTKPPSSSSLPKDSKAYREEVAVLVHQLEPDLSVTDTLKKHVNEEMQEAFRKGDIGWKDIAEHLKQLVDLKNSQSTAT